LFLSFFFSFLPSAGDQAQGLVHARQSILLIGYTPSPHLYPLLFNGTIPLQYPAFCLGLYQL
jgi:hypothetical protein